MGPGPTTISLFEAMQIWDWVQWRLPPDLWLECQGKLRSPSPPVPTDPLLAALFEELLSTQTTRQRRLQLLELLLRYLNRLLS